MTEDTLSMRGYLLGIGVAIAIFLLEEAIKHISAGLRFRRRLAVDVKIMVDYHQQELADVEREHKGLTAEEGASISVVPIWANDFSPMSNLYDNSAHVHPAVFHQVVRMYDTAGTIADIRKHHNEAVLQLIGREYSHGDTQYLDSTMSGIEKNCLDLIRRGAELLVDLAARYRFINVDATHYREIAQRYRER